MAKKKKKSAVKKKGLLSKLSPKVLLVLITVAAVVMMFMAAAILFILGMMPTLAAYLTDRIPGKNKTLTIGALNFAACFFYMMKIWTNPVPEDAAISYLSNPTTLIMIYVAALVGYMINHGVTVVVASILKQKSEARLNKIEEAKEQLVERWGVKVNGRKPLDIHGFPLDNRENFDS